MLLLWGISSTAVSALLVTRLVRWRGHLNQLLASSATASPPPPTLGPFFFFDFTRHRTRVSSSGRTAVLRTALQVLVLIEGSLGWVVGSAWTDVVVAWTSLVQYPTVAVTLKDFGVTVGLTVGGVAWLMLTGVGEHIEEAKKADRWHVEMYFLTRAMAFFVGWSWIALCRDVSTALAYHDAGTPVRNYVGQVAVAFALGPMLTIWLVRADDARRADAVAVAPVPMDGAPGKPVVTAVWRSPTAGDDAGSQTAAEEGNYVLADE